MADMRNLWWSAGRMAFSVAGDGDWRNQRWTEALRRSARLLEPVWPKNDSTGSFSNALPTLALPLYAVLDDDPQRVPVEDVMKHIAPDAADPSVPSLEDSVRLGLIKCRHDPEDDSPLSSLFRELATYRPPLAYTSTGTELASIDHWPGGTLMGAAAEWVGHAFTHHYLSHGSAR